MGNSKTTAILAAPSFDFSIPIPWFPVVQFYFLLYGRMAMRIGRFRTADCKAVLISWSG
jgi:hypothetical protein